MKLSSTTKLRKIALDYFSRNPEAKQVVIKKGKLLLRKEFKASHHFEYKNNKTLCWVCGQDWYAANMERCTGFQQLTEDAPTKIKRILKSEYELYMTTIYNCEQLVRASYSSWSSLTGKIVAKLYHTHGCGVEELEWIFGSNMPVQLKHDFELEMERERDRSRAAQKKQIITCL